MIWWKGKNVGLANRIWSLILNLKVPRNDKKPYAGRM
jgi:hypothetical protein